MNIEQARKLKVGQRIRYPSDRGSPAGTGVVKSVGTAENTSFHGDLYVWVEVDNVGHMSLWSSSRLMH